ncbi:MAG TPA: asparagine synthase (glutamine-hydrolyzing), partial [Gemmatimonadales bacterium]
ELRGELERDGVPFRSHGDTEVVLELYRRHGPAMLQRLNGMFAMAIWDERTAELFLARDRFGEKPLYLYQHGGGLLFGSEVKSFLQHPDFTPELDRTALLRYLTFLWVPEPNSMFAGVQKLPPGHYAIFKHGRLSVHQYWDLTLPRTSLTGDPRELTAEVRRRLILSVKRRLVSDRPVGAFLSGGIDSSTMLAAMAQASSSPVESYTIGFPPEDFAQYSQSSEVPLAKAVAERCGAQWQHIELDSRITDLLPLVVWHLDEPVADPAATTAYLLCKTAKPTRTVLMSGMGGDEVFAGYRRHLAFRVTAAYHRLPGPLRWGLLAPMLNGLRWVTRGPLAARLRDARTLVGNAELPFEQRFIGYARYYGPGELENLLSPDLRQFAAGVDVAATHATHFRASEGADPMARMLYEDMKTFMPSLNMLYMDKMSMATAVEGRLPFLDHELVEFAATIPPQLKIRGLTTKWILRKAFENDLPASVVWNRQKVGFGAPIRTWLSRDLGDMVRDVLSPDRLRARGLFNPDAVQRLLANPLRDRNDFRIWALLTLELWMQTFLDGARGRTGPINTTLSGAGAR